MDSPSATTREQPRLDDANGADEDVHQFCPQNMRLVSVLLCDSSTKRVVLHTRLISTPDKDAIVILEKSPFPGVASELIKTNVVRESMEAEPTDADYPEHKPTKRKITQSEWCADSIVSNDVYRRLYVTGGLDLVNGVDMTVIFPAEEHHFKRYRQSGCRIFQESREVYSSLIVPFLMQNPPDLSWVDNILSGKAEKDRVLSSDEDPEEGFTLVQDYRWNGRQLNDMHYLGIVRRTDLRCLRDLRASHVPLLKRLLDEGRKQLAAKYTIPEVDGHAQRLDEDQILAYIHYPPTFYHLHMHFVHVNIGENASMRAGRAHLVEEVIRNLELDSEYYLNRVMTIFMYENSPMFEAVSCTKNEKPQTQPTTKS
ncbi:unnamed protein product [Echinostoma caproni]|uniref:m7GpppX diphosphatase n=1 Tax=Echinostoma caproni TaxID=27848 RepID=A0A183AXQ1_9TREM|nr:unnamed protein product [Echinostoma caproni]